MTLLQQLHRWRNSLRRQGDEPTFIPLTAEELNVIASELPAVQWNQTFMVSPPEVFGIPVFDSPFAEEMRARQISLSVTRLEESSESSDFDEMVNPDYVRGTTRRRLTARICSDTTHLDLTFEFDPWAAFKRKFRLTRWFPVRTKTVRIDGRVLYPHLKITLPFNKHYATFAVNS